MDRVRESVREGVRDTRHIVMADSNTGNNRMLTLLVLLVGLICLANLIVVSVMLNKPVQPDVYLSPTINTMSNPLADKLTKLVDQAIHNISAPGTDAMAKQRRRRSVVMRNDDDFDTDVFLVQYGKTAASLLKNSDIHDGYITKVIREVCRAAGVVCLPVYDDDSNCLREKDGEHPIGGQGLLGGWYDACLGWTPTEDRQHVFSFSEAPVGSQFSLMTRKDSELVGLWDQGLQRLKEGGQLKTPCKKGDVACMRAGKLAAEEL